MSFFTRLFGIGGPAQQLQESRNEATKKYLEARSRVLFYQNEVEYQQKHIRLMDELIKEYEDGKAPSSSSTISADKPLFNKQRTEPL